MAEDAAVSVYVSAQLCVGAEEELARSGGRAGSVRVRAICLPAVGDADRLDLAAIGANARRASEDSSTVGYIGEPTKAATRFSAPILEEADIAQLAHQPGDVAMGSVLRALRQAGDAPSLRDSVNDELS